MSSQLRDHCELKGGTAFPEYFQGKKEGDIAFIKVSDISIPENRRYIQTANNYVSRRIANQLAANVFYAGTTVFAKVGAALLLNRRRILTSPTIIDNNMMAAIATTADPTFLYYFLCSIDLAKYVQLGALPSVNQTTLGAIQFPEFSRAEQKCIAHLLSSIDDAIEQTEALIAKMQKIKAGLIHDLFTRGIIPNGQLRPLREEAPQLYKESPLGWIPAEWSVYPLGCIAESMIDGPFGSNLKSEHYVDGSGVGVVRLQNILENEYNNSDRVFISEHRAMSLSRHSVTGGDVLIAALGDDTYPAGRACCYPEDLYPAINKADCFRMRSRPSLAINAFVMGFLNTRCARIQTSRFVQGVTRRRINLGNMRRILVPLPSIQEQKRIDAVLKQSTSGRIFLENWREKLAQQKSGLINDLLAGRVHVPESMLKEASASA